MIIRTRVSLLIFVHSKQFLMHRYNCVILTHGRNDIPSFMKTFHIPARTFERLQFYPKFSLSKHLLIFLIYLIVNIELRWHSRYGNWLRPTRTEVCISISGKVKNCHFFMSFRPAVGHTQPPVQWSPRALSPRVKRPRLEAEYSSPTIARSRKRGSIHPHPILLYGLVAI
jgi:hypothetical protein